MTHALAAADASSDAVAKPRGLKEIIEAAGGFGAIANASEGAVSVDAVYKWPKIGVADRHWPLLMRLCQVSADELLAANQAARAPASADAGQG